MTISKHFVGLVGSINSNNAPEKLRQIGESCVKQAYAGNFEETLYALNELTQWARKALASWLVARGLVVTQEGKTYACEAVKNQKRQAKAIEDAKTTPVLVVEHQEKKASTPKPLEGTPESRAKVRMAQVIKDLKKKDADAGNVLNELWGRKTDDVELAFEDGETFNLNAEEAAKVVKFIKQMRASQVKLARAA